MAKNNGFGGHVAYGLGQKTYRICSCRRHLVVTAPVCNVLLCTPRAKLGEGGQTPLHLGLTRNRTMGYIDVEKIFPGSSKAIIRLGLGDRAEEKLFTPGKQLSFGPSAR
jgi:hypothetical protein